MRNIKFVTNRSLEGIKMNELKKKQELCLANTKNEKKKHCLKVNRPCLPNTPLAKS
jgi:hypothetical protein